MTSGKSFTPTGELGAAWMRGAIGGIAIALCCSSVDAAQPPGDRCRPASKIEYDSAKRQYLLQNRFGSYVRTGYFGRRFYWYCQF